VSGADSPHCPGCAFTVAEWAGLRAWLALPDGYPDSRVGDALAALLDAGRVLSGEFEYLKVAAPIWGVDGA
jgi:hypothetical protein